LYDILYPNIWMCGIVPSIKYSQNENFQSFSSSLPFQTSTTL
jgi:hypothetical protein